MKRVLKAIGILIGVLVLLVVAAVIVLPLYIDPNDYKDEIAAQVEQRTGRELRIAGDIELSVFPWLGFDLGTVEIGNAPGFDERVFARSERLQLRVKLLPLLTREVEMDTVVVRGLTLNLARNAKGKTNWADLVAREAKKPEAPKSAEPRERAPIAALAVGGVDVRDATLRWDDAMTGRQYTIRDLRLQTGPLGLDRPVDLSLGLAFTGGQPPIEGELSASAQVRADLEARRYRAQGVAAELRLGGAGVPGKPLAARLTTSVDANLGEGRIQVQKLALESDVGDASGDVTVTEWPGKPQLAGTLALSDLNPRALLARLGNPPETADPEALTSARFEARLQGSQQRVRLDALSLRIDDTTLNGDLTVDDPAGRRALRFKLSADAIDLDRYLPPPGAGGAGSGQQAAAGPGAAAAAGGALPLEPLRALDAEGEVSVGRLRVSGLRLDALQVGVRAKDGRIRIHPLTADLYDGSYAGDLRLDARGERPRIQMDERLSGVQAGPLLEDLTGEQRLTGQAELQVNASARGAAPDAFKRTLDGEVAFRFTDGAVRGINIGRLLRVAKARLEGRSLSEGEGSVETDFTEITGSIQIRDGVARNDDLQAKSPLLRVRGQGTADLVQEQVDYRVTATVAATAEGQSGRELEELAGLPVPIRISGPLREPRIRPDVEALAKAIAQRKIEQRKGEVTEKIEQKIEEELGDKAGEQLKGILKGLTQ